MNFPSTFPFYSRCKINRYSSEISINGQQSILQISVVFSIRNNFIIDIFIMPPVSNCI